MAKTENGDNYSVDGDLDIRLTFLCDDNDEEVVAYLTKGDLLAMTEAIKAVDDTAKAVAHYLGEDGRNDKQKHNEVK